MNDGSEQQCYLAFEPKEEHMLLIESINTLSGEQDVGQHAPLQKSIAYLLKLHEKVNQEEMVKILKTASKTRVAVHQGISVPRSIKVWVRKSDIETIETIFKETFNILKVQRPFFVRVLLTTYWIYLKEENAKLGVPEEPVSIDIVGNILCENPDALLRFEASVKLANMLLQNEERDKEYIAKIMELIKQREM